MNDERLWQAFAQRRASPIVGVLVGVLTTGIYCRFGCPARMPKPGNVRFFASAASARAAGLRACKRCRPDEPLADAALIERAHGVLAREGMMPLGRLAGLLKVGPEALKGAFDRSLGLSAKRYDEARRIKALRSELADAATVTDAIYAAGFGGPRRVYEIGDAMLGMSPRRFRAGGAGEVIGYATAPCSLGYLLVAATPRGICQTAIGAVADDLVRLLALRFHQAQVSPDPALADMLAAIVAHIDAAAPLPELPLDIRATAFEARVWQALADIPKGTVRSYGDLAARIGAPGAARAVGRACGANPVAPLVPCHRAVAGDGRLTGYRWGLDAKRALLKSEGIALDSSQEKIADALDGRTDQNRA